MADENNARNPVKDLYESFAQFKRDDAASDLVIVAAHRCVEGGFSKEMAEAFLNQENLDVLAFVGWDLIGLLAKTHGKNSVYLLDTIGKVCSPKLVLLGVVEQMNASLPPQSFLMLLSPLKEAFSKLMARRSKFMKMVLPKLSRYVLELKDNDDENRKGDGFTSRLGLYHVLDKVIGLIDLLVEDSTAVETKKQIYQFDDPERESQSLEILKCLIALLEILASENLSSKMIESSPTRSYCCHGVYIAKLLCKLFYSAVSLIEYTMECIVAVTPNKTNSSQKIEPKSDQHSEDEEGFENKKDSEVFSPLGLGCFSYLSFVEGAGYVPQVFSLDYVLKINLVGISCLLQRSNEVISYKGIELLSSLTEKIEDGSLGYYFVKLEGFLDIPKAMINIMVYSSSKPLRTEAIGLLKNLIAKLEKRGRYVLLRYLLLECEHAGVAALLIETIKDEVHSSFDNHDTTWFMGKQLISLLHQVCKLPQGMGAEVDIVPETDRIIATLNCLRYILLRDGKDEITLQKNLTVFEKDFFHPLRELIKLSRLRYTAFQKQNENRSNLKGKAQDDDNNRIDFTVTTLDGTPISAMSLDDQIQVLQSGLYALNLMEYHLAYIAEIVNTRT